MIKKILKYKTVSILSALAACFVAGGAIWAYVTLRSINATVFILHFNDMAGITRVGSIRMILGMGAFGLVVVGINTFIALGFEERDPFLGKITAILTLIFGILLFMAFAAILNVN